MATLRATKAFCDSSKTPPLGPHEKRILRRLKAGDELLLGRMHDNKAYGGRTERIVNYFSWRFDSTDEFEWDSVVWMLMRRGLIRPIACAGGMTWLILTPWARRKRHDYERTD